MMLTFVVGCTFLDRFTQTHTYDPPALVLCPTPPCPESRLASSPQNSVMACDMPKRNLYPSSISLSPEKSVRPKGCRRIRRRRFRITQSHSTAPGSGRRRHRLSPVAL